MRRDSSYHSKNYAWGDLIIAGIKFVYGANAHNCHIDHEVKIGHGTVIWPDVTLLGTIEVGENCEIEKGATILGKGHIRSGTKIGQGVKIVNPRIGRNCVIEGQVIDSEIGEDCRVGRNSEIKRSTLYWGVNALHNCGVRDAEIGYLTNIGASTEILNSDGTGKYKTKIGNKCYLEGRIIGGVTIGNEARISPESLVTDDVPSMAWFVNPAPGAMPAKSYYKTIYSFRSWYLAGNYLLLKHSMPPDNRSEFLRKVWEVHHLWLGDDGFGEWLKTPIQHLAGRTPLKALQEDWKKFKDCIVNSCGHSRPD